jgi:xanthine/uracil permease
MSESPILYPEDRIPLQRLVPMGLQHVVARFGASRIAATGLGVEGVTVGGTNIAGIALGTVLALVLSLAFRTSPASRPAFALERPS